MFVYYVVMMMCSYLGGAFLPLAWLWAWMPNLIFTAIGIRRLQRAALRMNFVEVIRGVGNVYW